MADAEKTTLRVLDRTKALFAWIGGVTAGISALIYACGYLVTRAHLNLLGLYGLVDFNGEFFFQEGAKFLLAVPYSLGRSSLPLLLIAGAAFALWKSLGFLVAHSRLRSLFPALRARVGRESFRRKLRVFVYAALLVTLVFHATVILAELQQPISVSSLLYADPAAPKHAGTTDKSEAIEQALLHGQTATLDDLFETLLIDILAGSILAYLAWRVTRPWQLRAWLTAPFMIAVGLYVLLLPMAYGVLQRPIRYPRVALNMNDGSNISGEASPFLLSKGADAFILWDRVNRKLIWLPAGSVRRAEVWTVTALFADPHASVSSQEGVK